MTAYCGGGTSSLKPGVALRNVVGAGYVTLGLNALAPEFSYLSLLLDGFLVESTTQCSSDPPPQVTFDATDFTNCIGGALNPNCPGTLEKIKNVVLRYLWFQWCQCDSGSTPPMPPAIVPPGITAPTPSAASGCFSGSYAGDAFSVTGSNVGTVNASLLPPGPRAGAAGGPGQVTPGTVQVTPGQYTSVSISGVVSFPSNPVSAFFVQVYRFNSTGALINNDQISVGPTASTNVTFSHTFTIEPTTAYLAIYTQQLNEPNLAQCQVSDVFGCVGGGTGNTTNPCPEDPAVLTLLQEIYSLLQLVQRQAVPFAYVHGATHSNLTGSGEIAVQGLLGVKVMPQSIPPGVGIDFGDPDTLWLESWINWGNADGWTTREWLRTAPHISMPQYVGQFTKLGYTIRSGMAVDIIELVREP